MITIPTAQITHRKAVLIVPDGTRKLPVEAMLGEVLGHLQKAEVGSCQVLVALGLHRAMTDDESHGLREVCDRFEAELLQHDAHDSTMLHTLGEDIALFPGSQDGGTLPAVLHRAVCEAELIVCLGVVEPHQYAGFSGGVKAISIGCAGAQTIAALHGLEYLRHPRTTLGVIEGNPFRDALDRVASKLSAPVYAYHHVPATPSTPAESCFGEVHEAFRRACEMASERMFVTHPRRVPWVHLVVDGPKGVNFYQASRAATYVGLVEHPVVEPGGVILLEARCEEGMGEGAGERACAAMLARGHACLLAELEGREPVPDHIELSGGAQRAYVIARLLARHRLALVGASTSLSELPEDLVPRFEHVSEALAHYGLSGMPGMRIEDVFHAVPLWGGASHEE